MRVLDGQRQRRRRVERQLQLTRGERLDLRAAAPVIGGLDRVALAVMLQNVVFLIEHGRKLARHGGPGDADFQRLGLRRPQRRAEGRRRRLRCEGCASADFITKAADVPRRHEVAQDRRDGLGRIDELDAGDGEALPHDLRAQRAIRRHDERDLEARRQDDLVAHRQLRAADRHVEHHAVEEAARCAQRRHDHDADARRPAPVARPLRHVGDVPCSDAVHGSRFQKPGEA